MDNRLQMDDLVTEIAKQTAKRQSAGMSYDDTEIRTEIETIKNNLPHESNAITLEELDAICI